MPVRRVLIRYGLLDPRPASEAAQTPIRDAVNIQLADLRHRTHELPPREELVRVVGPSDLATQTVSWLVSHGRRAVVQEDFAPADSVDPGRIGRLWRPNPFLEEVLVQLAPGTALDLACGCGRDAVFMAVAGWHVTAIDVLPDALERARDLARRYAPAAGSIVWHQADLEADFSVLQQVLQPTLALSAPGAAAIASDPRPAFDLIVMLRYLHRPLLSQLAMWLRPGGSLVCEAFTAVHRARHRRPARDARVVQPGELPRLLAGLKIRHFSEGWRGVAHTARVWACRP